MIVLDQTIVNVALPAIQHDLGFSQDSLAWVVNAYMLTFGGFLLLTGRAADLLGRRAVLVAGLVAFTLASLACGLAGSQAMLVIARAVQGVGGAAVQAVSLSIIVTLFPEPAERAKAMGVWTFVAAGGGTIGVLLGGILTQVLSWHWIFLINIPVGIFRSRTIAVANAVIALFVASFFGWFFFVPLYMQRILNFTSFQTGASFLPVSLSIGILSIGVAARIIGRFGPRLPLVLGTA